VYVHGRTIGLLSTHRNRCIYFGTVFRKVGCGTSCVCTWPYYWFVEQPPEHMHMAVFLVWHPLHLHADRHVREHRRNSKECFASMDRNTCTHFGTVFRKDGCGTSCVCTLPYYWFVEQAVYVHCPTIGLLSTHNNNAYILERCSEKSVVEQAVYVHCPTIGLLSIHKNNACILERCPETSVVEQAVYVHCPTIGLLSFHKNNACILERCSEKVVEQAVYVHCPTIGLLSIHKNNACILERCSEKSVVEQAVYVHCPTIGLLSIHKNNARILERCSEKSVVEQAVYVHCLNRPAPRMILNLRAPRLCRIPYDVESGRPT